MEDKFKVLFGVSWLGFLAFCIWCAKTAHYYLHTEVENYCGGAARTLHPGEQSLCFVPENEKKAKIMVSGPFAASFSHYVFDEYPSYAPSIKSKDYSYTINNIPPNSHLYKEFSLPEDSVLTAVLDSDFDETEWFLVDDYIEDSFFSKYIPTSIWTASGSGQKSLNMPIKRSKAYYLYCHVKGKSDGSIANTKWSIHVDYSSFDLSKGEKVPCDKRTCVVHNVTGKFIVSALDESVPVGNLAIRDEIALGNPKKDTLKFIEWLAASILVFAIFAVVSVLMIIEIVNSFNSSG